MFFRWNIVIRNLPHAILLCIGSQDGRELIPASIVRGEPEANTVLATVLISWAITSAYCPSTQAMPVFIRSYGGAKPGLALFDKLEAFASFRQDVLGPQLPPCVAPDGSS